MTQKRSSTLAQAASILAPILLIAGMRVMLSPGPSQASAAASPMPGQTSLTIPASQPAAATLTAEQQRASDWRRGMKTESDLSSPMDRELDVVLLPKKEPLPPAPPPPAPKVNPVEGLALTGVLGDQRQSIAAISGKVYRVGERIKNGLTLTAVDSRRLSVTLTDDDGVEYVLRKEK
jgi:hypothetical protein